MKTVAARTCQLLSSDPIARDLLQGLYDTRNALVHHGYFPHERGLQEVMLLKNIAERSIFALLRQIGTLPTVASLARYYEYASASNNDLAERQRVIEAIRQSRM